MRRFRIRCSALPAAFACPPSVLPTDLQIDPVGEAADQGSASHEVMKHVAEMDAKSLDGIDLVAIARRFGADEDELRIQAFVGLKMWAAVRESFQDGQAEVELAQTFDLGDDVALELTGHADVLAVMRRQRFANLGDWKFGRVDRNHSHQVKGYMALILGTYPEIEAVNGFVGWARGIEPGSPPDIESYSMNREEMWDWLDELKRRVVVWDGVYHPGEQCAHCQRNHDCAALTAMARRDVLVLGGAEMAEQLKGGLAALPDRDLIAIRRRGKVIAKILENVDDILHRRVEAAPGRRIADGDGRELRLVDQPRRVIDPILGRPVLKERLTLEELARCTIYRGSRIDDEIGKKTARGGKKAAIEEVDAALRAAGAISEEKNPKLVDVRTKE